MEATGAGCADGGVRHVTACELNVGRGAWAFADANADQIGAHWSRRTREHPLLFNGKVFLLRRRELVGDTLEGAFSQTEFKSYLYWREQGFPEAGAWDCFGSCLLFSAEGHVLLGRQRAGNINGGRAYPMGGFIDARDIDADGRIDLAGSVAREIGEETGLDCRELERVPGYTVTFAGALVSIAVAYRSGLAAVDLRGRVRAFLHAEQEPELEDLVIVRSAGEIDARTMPVYTQVLLNAVLP